MAYTKTTWEDLPSEDTPITSANLQKIEDAMFLNDEILTNIVTGWIDSKETWTYNSASSFLVSGDVTGKYQVGDKFKMTQTTNKFFICTAISYSAPNTTITVDGFGISTIANATINNPYYSKMDSPQGFPLKEKLLFNGTPTASVTLSETSANFDYLEVWYEGNNDGGIMGIPYYYAKMNLSLPDLTAMAVDLGYLDSDYRIRTSGGILTASGTTLSITGSGTNYSSTTTAGSTSVAFQDTKFIPKITKVLGIRW